MMINSSRAILVRKTSGNETFAEAPDASRLKLVTRLISIGLTETVFIFTVSHDAKEFALRSRVVFF
jgi:hypothetical protein